MFRSSPFSLLPFLHCILYPDCCTGLSILLRLVYTHLLSFISEARKVFLTGTALLNIELSSLTGATPTVVTENVLDPVVISVGDAVNGMKEKVCKVHFWKY